jgi:hypothetical protein
MAVHAGKAILLLPCQKKEKNHARPKRQAYSQFRAFSAARRPFLFPNMKLASRNGTSLALIIYHLSFINDQLLFINQLDMDYN